MEASPNSIRFKFQELRHPKEIARFRRIVPTLWVQLLLIIGMGIFAILALIQGIYEFYHWWTTSAYFGSSSDDMNSLIPQWIVERIFSNSYSAILGLIVIAIGTIAFYFFFFYLGLIIIFWFRERIRRSTLEEKAVKINEHHFPEIHTLFTTLKEELDFKHLDLYIIQDDQLEAKFTRRLRPGRGYMVLSSALMKALVKPENSLQLRWILVYYLSVEKAYFSPPKSSLPPRWLRTLMALTDYSKSFGLYLNAYYRGIHFTADQVATYAVGDVNLSLAALHRLLVGHKLSPQISIQATIRQVLKNQRPWLDFWGRMYLQKPFLLARYINVLSFTQKTFPKEYNAFKESLDEESNKKLPLYFKRYYATRIYVITFLSPILLVLLLYLFVGYTFINAIFSKNPFRFASNKFKKFDEVELLETETLRDARLLVKEGNTFGLASITGKVILSPRYDRIWKPKNGLAVAKKADKYGFIDRNGKVVIPFKYEGVYDFNHKFPYTAAQKDKKFGFIDKRGWQVIPFEYDHVSPFYGEGYSLVKKEGKYGYISVKGNEIIPIIYDSLSTQPQEGSFVFAKKDGKYGVLNFFGKELIPFEYDYLRTWEERSVFDEYYDYNYASDFLEPSRGFALLVKKNEKYGILHTRGEVILPVEYTSIGNFRERYYPEREVIDEERIRYAELKKNDKMGIMNAQGEILIPCEYDEIDFTYNPVHPFKARKDFKFSYIDAQGNIVKTETDSSYFYLRNLDIAPDLDGAEKELEEIDLEIDLDSEEN